MRLARPAVAFAIATLATCASWNAAGGQDVPANFPANARPASTAAASPTPVQATVTFAFAREGVGAPVPKFTLIVRDDGTGSYEGEALPSTTSYGPAAAPSVAQPFRRDLRISPATAARIFMLSARLNHFNQVCASKAKNIADTGTKTLTYAGADGAGSCTYNYTEIKQLQTLTEIFEGIAETMDEGRELDRLHRYDRLGLDSAMSYLEQQVAAGRALEVGTIEASLRSIAEDAEVLARVRSKANALLAQIAAQPDASAR